MKIFLLLLISLTSWARIIGIIGALDAEIKLLKKKIKIVKTETIAKKKFHIGNYFNNKIILTKSGIGKVNSAICCQILISKYKSELIIFTGICGGINPELKPGDIIIATEIIQHDVGKHKSGKFIPEGKNYPSDKKLIELAYSSAKELKLLHFLSKPPNIYKERIVTGDQFIACEKKRKWLWKTFKPYGVEMEGGAIAQVCHMYDVPFVVIRCVSDLANEFADIDMLKFIKCASENSAMITIRILEKLKK